MKKIIFKFISFLVFLLIIWQGAFWIGEYQGFRKYNETMGKINQEISFRDWATNYSFQKMLVVGNLLQYKNYRDYVAVQASADKPYVLWEEWKRSAKEIEDISQGTVNLIESELALEEADTYGGDTPEETWEMFLDALRDGDVELASKYFVPKKQAEHLAWFQKAQEEGMLEKMVEDLSVGEPQDDKILDTIAWYRIAMIDDSGKNINSSLRFRKNLNSKWKLESI